MANGDVFRKVGGAWVLVGNLSGPPGSGSGGSGSSTTHDEPLTDGNSNLIFAAGDVIMVLGVVN
jgi:hypothetical protein